MATNISASFEGRIKPPGLAVAPRNTRAVGTSRAGNWDGDPALVWRAKELKMKTLRVKWERLVSEGRTCPRCGATGKELEEAISALRQSLSCFGIEVLFQKEELSAADFGRNPLQSNRIWLNDRSLEDWIGGKPGQSTCCDVCGPASCRTVAVGGDVHETIPAGLVIKAGLLAASDLI